MAKVDWNQEEHGTSQGFDALPKGRYLAVITDSEEMPTKKKDGKYYEFEFVVRAPKEFAKRKIWARFNIHNPSEEAQRIGREQFNSLADCCGLLGKVKKTEDLHDKAVVVLLGVRDYQGRDVNEVLGFQKHEGPAPSARPAEEKRPAAPKAEDAKKPDAPKPKGKFDDDDDIPF